MMLIDEHRGSVYHLNKSGATAFAALLDDGIGTAVTALCAQYAVSAETAQRDIVQLLDVLLMHHLVVPS